MAKSASQQDSAGHALGVRNVGAYCVLHRVILPHDNEKDLSELPEPVRNEMEFVLASRIEDALTAAIPQLADRLEPVPAG